MGNSYYHPSKKEYTEFVNKHFSKDHPKCIYCGDEIYYRTTKIQNSESHPKLLRSTFETSKILNNHKYNLCVCQDCLEKQFPEHHNYSKLFNTRNKKTKYAFNISDEDYEAEGKNISNTLKNYIKKYGEIEGHKKWDEYRAIQKYTNTFEYKHNKYGWTQEQYNEYNQKRAVTKQNMIKRWGEKEGIKKWNSYCEKQKTTKSKEYLIKKYGIDRFNKINESKSQTLDNFIKRYGEQEGLIKYNHMVDAHHTFYSNISQKFFKEIDNIFTSRGCTTYYATKNTEYKLKYGKTLLCMDYFIKELNTCIEFNGTNFHADPRKYKANDHPNPFNKKQTAKSIWNADKKRYEYLKNTYNIKTVIIWEDDYKSNFNLHDFIMNNFNIDIDE